MRNKILEIFILGSLTACSVAPKAENNFVTLKIYHTNDIHSHLIPNSRGQGGLAYLASVLKGIRSQEGKQALILDAGDMYKKGHLPARITQDVLMADLVAQMPYYDARVLGNNEIKVGISQFQQWAKKKEPAPILSANFVDKDNHAAFYPYYIFEKMGLKVGVIGLTYEDTFEDASAPYLQPDPKKDKQAPYKILKPEVVLPALIAKLRPQVQVLIVLSHEDHKMERKLMTAFPQVDLFVCGHSHILTGDQKSTGAPLLVEAGEFGQQLGVVTLVYDRQQKKVVSEEATTWPIGPSLQLPDKEMAQLIDAAYKKYAPDATQKLGEAKGTFTLLRSASPYEGSLDDWVADVMKEHTSADAAMVNHDMLRETIYPGPVTKDLLYLASPYNDRIAVVVMKREKLEAMIRHRFIDYFEKVGALPFGISGLTLKLKLQNQKLSILKLIWEHPKSLIRVAFPDYVAQNCALFFRAADCPFPVVALGDDLRTVLEKKVVAAKVIEPPALDRVSVRGLLEDDAQEERDQMGDIGVDE